MAKMTKAQRAVLRDMFSGRCSYCGHELGERWHADHFQPIEREVGHKGNLLGVRYPERDTVANMMPACAPCNISKASLTIEQWRGWLVGHVKSLNAHNTPYRLAKNFGLIVETAAPVIFHFERTTAQAKEPA